MNRLKAVRRQAGINQYQLAEQLGKGQSYVSKYERCERRLDVVEFLDVANVLGVDPVDLIKGLPEPSKRAV